MVVKLAKYANDPCFGSKYEKIAQCSDCWVKNSCFVTFRNRKD